MKCGIVFWYYLPDPPAIACGEAMAGRSSNSMFYTYVLQSIKDKKLYIGWTNDLKNRFKDHNSGKVDSTKNRTPLLLIYYEACLVKEKAISREKYLKTGFGRKFLKGRI